MFICYIISTITLINIYRAVVYRRCIRNGNSLNLTLSEKSPVPQKLILNVIFVTH